jgi:hypothetical protein
MCRVAGVHRRRVPRRKRKNNEADSIIDAFNIFKQINNCNVRREKKGHERNNEKMGKHKEWSTNMTD